MTDWTDVHLDRARKHWKLDADGEPEECDLMTWAVWMEVSGNDRVIACDADEQTGWRVSTVFLGLDFSHGFGDVPILWETMVFGGPLDGAGERYASKADALDGHRRMCAQVTEVLAAGRPVTEED